MKIINIQVIDTCIQDAKTNTFQVPEGLLEELCDTEDLMRVLSNVVRNYMREVSAKADILLKAHKGGLNDKKGD